MIRMREAVPGAAGGSGDTVLIFHDGPLSGRPAFRIGRLGPVNISISVGMSRLVIALLLPFTLPNPIRRT